MTIDNADTPVTTRTPDRSVRRPVEMPQAKGIRAARFALPAILLAFIVAFGILRPSTFLTIDNFQTVLVQQSVLAILSIAALLPLIIGEFDLSIGAVLGAGAILATGLTGLSGLPTPVAILLALAVTTGIGLVNGVLVARLGINAFVATLATGTLVGGLVLWYTNGQVIVQGIPKSLTALGGNGPWGIPLPIVYAAVVAIAVGYLLKFTPVGRYLYAIGGSKHAARLVGIPVTRLTLGVFVLTGFLAGLAGVLLAARLGSGNPTSGPAYLLPAFAACFLGATAIKPGTFNVTGTICAVLTIAIGTTGLELLGVPFYIEPIFSGLVLVAAAIATRYLRRERTSG
jgi:ribose transport system permease protein